MSSYIISTYLLLSLFRPQTVPKAIVMQHTCPMSLLRLYLELFICSLLVPCLCSGAPFSGTFLSLVSVQTVPGVLVLKPARTLSITVQTVPGALVLQPACLWHFNSELPPQHQLVVSLGQVQGCQHLLINIYSCNMQGDPNKTLFSY